MPSIADQIESDTAEAIVAQAQAQGLSVDEYLRTLLSKSNGIELNSRAIDETQAANLRTRLKTFEEDWNRPEADIYDEDPPR